MFLISSFSQLLKKKLHNLRPANENPCKIKRQTIQHPYIKFKSYKKGLQEDTGGYKGLTGLQGVTGGNKGIQEVKGDYRQIHCTEG